MIGALVSRLSLELTSRLVAAGLIASTLTVVGATVTTPVVVETNEPHQVTRPIHAVVSIPGVTIQRTNPDGQLVTDLVWVCSMVDETHLALSSYDEAGAAVTSIGSGVYTSGGSLSVAFPDGSILLGRRNVSMSTAVATPRIVFVPTGSPEWTLDPYGGAIPTSTIPRKLSAETAEQKTMKLARQLVTEKQRFEVHVTAAATPPDPDFGDFDSCQALYQSLYGVMFDLLSPARARVMGGAWASQKDDVGQLDSRGQKWVGVVEIAQPVTDQPLAFVPSSTSSLLTVAFAGATTDQTTILLPPVQP